MQLRFLRNFPRLPPPKKVLGIETSFDETAAGVVDENRTILGECTVSQKHNPFGGVGPFAAQKLHQANVETVVEKCMSRSGLDFKDLDAIAVTTRPGLVSCLTVGVQHALRLCKRHEKPLIKVHHMRAHALTERLVEPKLQYPFLCLLISGGHCILCLVERNDRFKLLGQCLDDSPGEALDKVARRLRLQHFRPEFKSLSGGAAIEQIAKHGNPRAYELTEMMLRRQSNCNFSFSGLKRNAMLLIEQMESEEDIRGFGFIKNIEDFAASFQHAVFRQLAKRVQRAIEIVDNKGIIKYERHGDTENFERCLVVSGGVAANAYINSGLRYVAKQYGYRILSPPPSLCTDNGIMIAWNGLEILRWSPDSEDIVREIPEKLWVERKEAIGNEDMSQEISQMRWKIQRVFSINQPQLFQS